VTIINSIQGGALELLTGLDANPDNLVLSGVLPSRDSGAEDVKPAFGVSIVLARYEYKLIHRCAALHVFAQD